MILRPANTEQLSQMLADAFSKKEKVERVELAALNRVLEYTPEDMTVTVEAGITLAALQAELGRHRQWLPLDPPHLERVTISEILNANISGPRRFGYGTIRDYLIGITVIQADGTVIHSGGKVVKNVAGYDLLKLFIGSHSSLGVTVEATFKLRPIPELELFAQTQCDSLEKADQLIEAVIQSPVTPIVLDLHKLSGSSALTIILGFAGSREEVEWQMDRVAELGFKQPSSLDYAKEFWSNAAPAQRLSVLSSKMVEAIRGLNGATFIARAGNGIVYHRGTSTAGKEELPLALMRRVKEAYDPRHILPGLPAVAFPLTPPSPPMGAREKNAESLPLE